MQRIPSSTALRARREFWTACAFLSPWIVGFLLFSGVPILASFAISLTKWNMADTPRLVGLQNYTEMFAFDSSFWKILLNTAYFTVLSVIVTLSWALGTALLLNRKSHLSPLFQFLFFVPAVMPSVALAFAFQILLNQEVGLVNYWLGFFGVPNGPNWLMDNHLVFPVIIFISIYTFSTGQMMLIFVASLKEVPQELYEAAEMDGAGAWAKFRSVTLASISPILLFNLVIATINALNGSFSIIYPLTNGGPAMASEVLSLAIYHEGFQTFRMGYASALSTVMFILVAMVSFLQFRMSSRMVSYEN